MTCDRCRARIVEGWVPGAPVPADPSLHLEACEACRSWFAAFGDGWALAAEAGHGLAAGVLARTSGSVCSRAQGLLAGRAEVPLDDVASTLLADHLEHCAVCAEFASVWDNVQATLPSLATLDPGPGFAERVIERTSRRVARPTLAERWRGVWGRLVRRPRFAWEVAYVATLCWLVFFGPSLSAVEWTTSKVASVAREHVPSKLDAVGRVFGQWSTSVASELETASAAVEQDGASWAAAAASAFQSGIDWTRQTAIAILERLEAAIQATVAWFRDFLAGLAAQPTEPPASPTRSSQ